MFSWITKALKYVPGIGALIEKVTGDSARAEELRAQAELDDIKGFHRTGRVSAAHLWKYAKVVLAIMIALTLCVSIFFPGAADNLGTMLGHFVDAVKQLFDVGM